MQKIEVYDIEAERLEELADKYDVRIADIVEALVDAVEHGDINLEDYT